MTHINFLRHSKFFGPEDVSGVTLNIIGVGATGSWVGLIAAKMGWHNFQVWDLDIVESHNCPNQIYDLDQVGMKKVDAFEQVLKRFNPNVKVIKHDCFFTSEKHSDLLEDAVFIAVDSLSARKDIASCLTDNFFLDIVTETKMGFSHAELNVLDPCDESSIQNYISTLKNDDEITESACNERIITTLTAIVASNVAHTLCNFYSSERTKNEIKLPSKTIFNFNQNSTLTTYNL